MPLVSVRERVVVVPGFVVAFEDALGDVLVAGRIPVSHAVAESVEGFLWET